MIKAKTFYFLILFGLTAICTIIGIVLTHSITNFSFENMCNSNDTHGVQDMKNCLSARDFFGNPIVEFFVIYPTLIVFTRITIIGPRKEFLAKNPSELHSVFDKDNNKDEDLK